MSFDRIFLWEKSMIIVNFIVDHFYRSELVRKKARLKRNLSKKLIVSFILKRISSSEIFFLNNKSRRR